MRRPFYLPLCVPRLVIDTLIQEAAALMESRANNHPFMDGNKRVAFFVTDTFYA
jgi:prophage maintenance system killer protein